jgi:uncharacterized damage-inducible protein DinB
MLDMRPAASEYAPFYGRYVAAVPDGRLWEVLAAQPADLRVIAEAQGDDRASLPSAPGKWSLKELLNHMIDVERVFSGRLLWFAREPGSSLPGFDQDRWVPAADAHRRPLPDLLQEFTAVRLATTLLLRSLPEAAAVRTGLADGRPASVRAMAWIIAGHAQHHIDRLRTQVVQLV